MTKSLEATMYIEELKSKIKLLENSRYPRDEEDHKGLAEEILKSAENLKNVFYKNSEGENSDSLTGKREIEVKSCVVLGMTYSKKEILLFDGKKVSFVKSEDLKGYL